MKNFSKYGFLLLLLFVVRCSNDNHTDQTEILGTWELSRIAYDSAGSSQLPPNDGRPVRINFMQNGTCEGVDGNNKIFGDFTIENTTLKMNLTTTEVSNTDWEQSFNRALLQTRYENGLVLPFTISLSELILRFGELGRLIFLRI